MVEVNNKGEVVNIAEADQFQPAKSQFMCGFFACAMAASMARPGQPATLSVQQIIDSAEKWYAQYDGSDAANNERGMTSEQEYELLHQIGLHYQAIDTQIDQVKAWVSAGYPVMIAVEEASVHDLALDGAMPYPWHATGTHIIMVTGVRTDGNILVRDSANCTSLWNPATLRPGPRIYKASTLQLVSATVVVPPWRPRPASATAIPQEDASIPEGWNDDGTTLTAPNGVSVTDDFRKYIHSHNWDAADVLLALEENVNPVELGFSQDDGNNAGTRLICMYSELCQTQARGVYRASVGREFWTLLQQGQSKPVNEAAKTNVQTAAKLIEETATHLIEQAGQL